MTQAYIFDLDGTLVDTEMIWVKALEQYLAEKKHALDHDRCVDIVYGKAWTDIYSEVVRRFPDLAVGIDRMADGLKRHFVDACEGGDIRIPESIELLQRLAEDHPVCVVSGSSRKEIAEHIEAIGVDRLLRFFLGSDDYSPGKPDPACFLKAANMLHVEPEACVVFEDSEAGVAAAKLAGMFCVALKRPGLPPQDLSAADRVLESLAQFDVGEWNGREKS